MKILDVLLEELLLELSGQEIHQKYYSKIPYETFVTLMQKLIAGVPHDYEEDDP